jgi:hypothetical protein
LQTLEEEGKMRLALLGQPVPKAPSPNPIATLRGEKEYPRVVEK